MSMLCFSNIKHIDHDHAFWSPLAFNFMNKKQLFKISILCSAEEESAGLERHC